MEFDLLVIGAGPVGLAGALFAHRNGFKVRIVDRRIEPVPQSKALAVNPRTLEILEATGITDKMLKLGTKVPGAKLWRENHEPIADMIFEDLETKFPFMLALSQAVTERLLTEALAADGIQVERGQEVVGIANFSGGVETGFADGSEIRTKYVFAADGSHSVAREKLKIEFEGDSLPGDWYLADVALKTDLPANRANVIFLDGKGFYFCLPVVEDASKPTKGDPVWRIMATHPNFLKDFKFGTPTAKPVWESKFKISHRISHSLRSGGVFFAGDAAHVHSPVGARGMNLGIEDAFVFAKLLKEDRLVDYDEERRAVDQSVVRKVDLLSHFAVGNYWFQRVFRLHALPHLMKIKPVRQAMARAMSGLDHPLG